MNEPPHTTTFMNRDDVQVGVQAETIHEQNNFYTLSSNPNREERFRIGVRHLQGRMAGTARKLIHDAVAEGYLTSESCFYWWLAMFSNRTMRQLTDDERASVKDHPRLLLPAHESDGWTGGVQVIEGLLESLDKPDAERSLEVMMRLDRLAQTQRVEIINHLGLVLGGWMEDQIWHRSLDQAEEQRMARDREGRVWKFFQPVPAHPRVRQPDPVSIPAQTWIWLSLVTTAAVLAAGHIAIVLVIHSDATGVLAILSAILGGYALGYFGTEWRFRAQRLQAKEDETLPYDLQITIAPVGGFTAQVHRLFDHYFALYVPHDVDRATWLEETVGIRRSLREEILEVYRESRVSAKQVAWLIRFRVSQVRQGWTAGTLLSYRDELRTPFSTKALTLLGVVALGVGGTWAVIDALRIDLMDGLISLFILLVSGKLANVGWARITFARRSFVLDRDESVRRLAASEAAYERWVARLADKPSDTEMASWLDFDRKVLMKRALEHYKLKARDIIAHAFIEAPGQNCDKARIKNGPWRYSRYTLLVFALTSDGVRQISVDLDFTIGRFRNEARINYRFDAVASVEVIEGSEEERTFELALMNSHSIKVQVMEAGMRTLPEENASVVTEATLDSAGLSNTLHVLEGIAAEGRCWVDREYERIATF